VRARRRKGDAWRLRNGPALVSVIGGNDAPDGLHGPRTAVDDDFERSVRLDLNEKEEVTRAEKALMQADLVVPDFGAAERMRDEPADEDVFACAGAGGQLGEEVLEPGDLLLGEEEGRPALVPAGDGIPVMDVEFAGRDFAHERAANTQRDGAARGADALSADRLEERSGADDAAVFAIGLPDDEAIGTIVTGGGEPFHAQLP